MNSTTSATLRRIGNKVLLVLLSILMIIGIIYSILIQIIFSNLLNPDSIRTLLSEANFYEISKPTIASIIFNFSDNSENDHVYSNQLSIDTWKNVAEIIFPTEWVKDTVDNIINSLWEWLNSPEDTLPNISINLSSPVDILRSRQGTLAFLPLLQDLPNCANIDLTTQIYQKGIPDCIPYKSNYIEVSQLIAVNFSYTIIENINFEILESQGYINKKSISEMNKFHTIYSGIISTRYYSIFITIIFFILYCLLTLIHSRKDLRTLMTPILIASLILLALFGFFWAFIRWGWDLFLNTNLNSLDSNSLTLIKEIGFQLSNQIVNSGISIAIVMLISSSGIWLLLHFLHLRNEELVNNENMNKLRTRRAIRKQFR